jgi:ankyrin repeat protein
MNSLIKSIVSKDIELYYSSITVNNVNDIYDNQQNLLHIAIAFKNNEVVDDLLTKGINLNLQDKNGQSPLHYAAAHSNEFIANLLVMNGTDINLKDNWGNTPLWTAVFNSKSFYKIVELLVKNGADVKNVNNAGRSPLDFAKQIEDENLIKILEDS